MECPAVFQDCPLCRCDDLAERIRGLFPQHFLRYLGQHIQIAVQAVPELSLGGRAQPCACKHHVDLGEKVVRALSAVGGLELLNDLNPIVLERDCHGPKGAIKRRGGRPGV